VQLLIVRALTILQISPQTKLFKQVGGLPMHLRRMSKSEYILKRASIPVVFLPSQHHGFRVQNTPASTLRTEQGMGQRHQFTYCHRQDPMLVFVPWCTRDADDAERQERQGAAVLTACQCGLLR